MISRWIDRLLTILLPIRGGRNLNWEMDADYAGIDQEPLRARSLLYFAGFILFVLVCWAALTEIEEVTRGEGRVIPSHQVQVIQAVDGGVVSEIAVEEGHVVDVGQLLLRIDPTRFVSSLRENRSQYMALLVKSERLKALSENRPFMSPAELQEKDQGLLEREQRLYESSRNELDAQLGVSRQQLQQRHEELREAEANLDQLVHRLELLVKEFDVTKSLLDSGAVSEVELLRLEREVIQTSGEREQVSAQVDRVQSSITEARRRIHEVELAFYNQVRRELSEVQAKLSSLNEEKTTLADRVMHADVKSPVRGTVNRLYVNTLGAVVQPGKEVVEIVPLDDILVLEAKINPKDIAFLRPGLKAQVKFTAYDYAIYGSLEAVVDQIGADTVVDEQGNAYYMVRVHTIKPELGENLPIIPGMVAQVDIITGQKTLLTYLLKPILRAKAMAFRER
jgi:adhesin transport system membrane fusion protein